MWHCVECLALWQEQKYSILTSQNQHEAKQKDPTDNFNVVFKNN